ncbi:MAG: hypothetical protein WA383_10085 [Terriglobales bacterium]|jgi:hypothetical protein
MPAEPLLREVETLSDGKHSCGEEVVIGHQPAFVDKRIAEKQAAWLEKVLAEEHESDKKHPDRIELRTDLREPGPFSRRWKSRIVRPTAARILPSLSRGLAPSCQILLIERLAYQRLDHRLAADVQLFGGPVQFF